MRLDVLDEFILFAKHLNYTHAANELHMSQSNLSKHIQQLESSLKVKLITHDGRKLKLTPAGSYFLERASAIQKDLGDATLECQRIQREGQLQLVVEEAPFNDDTEVRYFELLNDIKRAYPKVSIQFKVAIRNYPLQNILDGSRDILLHYEGRSAKDAAEYFTGEGLAFYHLAKVPLAIWCDKNSKFAHMNGLKLEDMNGAGIYSPNDTHSFASGPFRTLCARYDIEPNFSLVHFNRKADFLFQSSFESVYIYPLSLECQPFIKGRSDMVFVPFSDSRAFVDSYVLVKRDAPVHDMLEKMERLSS